MEELGVWFVENFAGLLTIILLLFIFYSGFVCGKFYATKFYINKLTARLASIDKLIRQNKN